MRRYWKINFHIMAKIFKLDRWRRDGSHFKLRFLSVSILHVKKIKTWPKTFNPTRARNQNIPEVIRIPEYPTIKADPQIPFLNLQEISPCVQILDVLFYRWHR